jgi:hypothetical protein
VVSHDPSDFAAAPLDRVQFTFDRPMDQSSFSIPDDIARFTTPSGTNIEPTGFNWVDDRTLELIFTPQTALGPYEIVLGPDIRGIGGNLIDQDRDGLFLESPGDQYSGTFTLAELLTVSGNITDDTTWNGRVVVEDYVSVKAPATLTINPGTIIKFKPLKQLTIDAGAVLDAPGTASQPIYFTSIRDDTVGGDTERDKDRTSPAAGDWLSILNNGGTASFDHAFIRYGGGSSTGGLAGMLRTSLASAVLNGVGHCRRREWPRADGHDNRVRRRLRHRHFATGNLCGLCRRTRLRRLDTDERGDQRRQRHRKYQFPLEPRRNLRPTPRG